MTASMFDLSMKEKPRSPFSKLKDKVKGRKHDSGFGDASSAILPRSAVCDSEPTRQSGAPERQSQPETKVKRPLLAGAHKLSAAHSMSDLIGTHFRPKLDSMNSIEESGEDQRFCFSTVVCYICHFLVWYTFIAARVISEEDFDTVLKPVLILTEAADAFLLLCL